MKNNLSSYVIIYNDKLQKWQVWNDYILNDIIRYFDNESDAKEYIQKS